MSCQVTALIVGSRLIRDSIAAVEPCTVARVGRVDRHAVRHGRRFGELQPAQLTTLLTGLEPRRHLDLLDQLPGQLEDNVWTLRRELVAVSRSPAAAPHSHPEFALKRYPTPDSVTMICGRPGSCSIFRRSCATKVRRLTRPSS